MTSNLPNETVNKLQDLIQYNIDAKDGFSEAAEKIENTQIAGLFRDYAAQRARFAQELQTYVAAAHEDPKTKGSLSAAAHRTWMGLREALSGNDVHAVLAEAERGEDAIKSKYEDVLQDGSAAPVSDVLQRQYVEIKQAHDRVRDLRDAWKN